MGNLRLAIGATAIACIPFAAAANPIIAFLLPASLGPLTAASVVISQIISTVALIALDRILAPRQRSNSATISDARVNVRLDTAPRWQAAGTATVGGSAGVFGEKDDAGNLWYIVAHADAELTGTPSYYLDDVLVTLSDGSGGYTTGDVLTDAFCLTTDGKQYDGTGTRVAVFRVYTVTPSSAALYGAKPAAFTAAFPSLPADFLLAGVTYTIIRCAALDPARYRVAMHWRGALGLGEPSVVILGNFNRMYDPRNVVHNINDSTTWTAGNGNPAIIWGWFRTTRYGRNRPMTEVNWTNVATQANICDTTVLNRLGAPVPLYRFGGAWPDNKLRFECEKDILECADAFVAYDSAGLAYPVVGYYAAPTLTFSAARDIMAAQTQITDDGEVAVDGVVVNYLEPSLNYTKQPCAPWKNANWYTGSAAANYYTVDVLGCQNHNQAVRLAKAIGLRMGATQRATFGTSIKGILVTSERSITLDYDATFQGVYEVVTPVDTDPSGIACSFGVVPLSLDKWYLNGGEEGAPPQATPALGLTDPLTAPAGVVLTTSGLQIKAAFTAPARSDVVFAFRYRVASSSTGYQYFIVNMTASEGYSPAVVNGTIYEVSYRTEGPNGRATAWSSVTNVTVQSNPTAPAALTAASATGGVGAATVNFTTANDANQYAVAVYRNTVNVFGSATLVHTVYVGPNSATYDTNTGLSAGTYYFWAVPLNNSNVAGATSGGYSATVT